MVIAINIKTDRWNDVIQRLLEQGWKTKYRYDNFDAGIDFDFLILRKDSEEIVLGWNNWFEGEIKCTEQQLARIEDLIKYRFETGEPNCLTPEVIAMYRI